MSESQSDQPDVVDWSAAVIAGLLIVAMVFFGAVAKHDNPSWNKMLGQAKGMLGLNTPVISKKSKDE